MPQTWHFHPAHSLHWRANLRQPRGYFLRFLIVRPRFFGGAYGLPIANLYELYKALTNYQEDRLHRDVAYTSTRRKPQPDERRAGAGQLATWALCSSARLLAPGRDHSCNFVYVALGVVFRGRCIDRDYLCHCLTRVAVDLASNVGSNEPVPILIALCP